MISIFENFDGIYLTLSVLSNQSRQICLQLDFLRKPFLFLDRKSTLSPVSQNLCHVVSIVQSAQINISYSYLFICTTFLSLTFVLLQGPRYAGGVSLHRPTYPDRRELDPSKSEL